MRAPVLIVLALTAAGCGELPRAWTPVRAGDAPACAAHAGVRRMTLLIHGLD